MEKKLSTNEREEVVTKGYLEDFMESRQYVTKEYMESKQYVTKDYLDDRLDKHQKEYFTHIEALMEDYHGRMYTLVELFERRFERVEHRLDILEA